MKVGLVGFGKAGKAVANVVLHDSNFTLEWVLRRSMPAKQLTVTELLGATSSDRATMHSLQQIPVADLLDRDPVDVIIDFSSENGVKTYGYEAAKRKVKIISAVSHYTDETIGLLKHLSQETVVFWSPNITFGVNYLLFAAKFLQKIAPWADIKISEEHFREKKGISGTAKIIANELSVDSDDINTSRIGGIVGRHEVVFGFPYQTVRLTHESISREAFGTGALFAATSLAEKKTGFFKFEDLLLPHFSAASGT